MFGIPFVMKAAALVFTLLFATLVFSLVEMTATCVFIDMNSSLDKDLENCLKIIKSSVNLDCKGFALKASSANYNYGIGLENVSSAVIKNCFIKNFYQGIYARNSSLTLENTNFDNSIDIFLYNSSAKAINSTYRSAHLENSELQRYWFLNIFVSDSAGSALAYADVNVFDVYGNKLFAGKTGNSGYLKQMLPEYYESAGKIFYSNYTITAAKSGYEWMERKINLTESKDVSIVLKNIITALPYYSYYSVNSTSAGSAVEFVVKWFDNVGLSGYIFSMDNCEGRFVNDTWKPLQGKEALASAVKITNSSICEVRWIMYANNTNGVWFSTPVYAFVTTIGNVTQEIERIKNATEINMTEWEIIQNIQNISAIPIVFENKTVRIAENISLKIERDKLKIEMEALKLEEPVKINMQPLNRTLVEIEINVAKAVEKSSILVQELKEAPEEVKPLDQAHSYLNISTEQLKSEDVKSAKIKFKLEKSWLFTRNLKADEISLYRWVGEWTELNTSLQSQDEYYAYYEALSPGFSYFAIAVSAAAVAPVEIFTPTEGEEIFRIRFSWVLVAAIIGIILFLRYSPIGKKIKLLASKKEEIEELEMEKGELKVMRDETLKKFYKRFITEQELKDIFADLKKREIEIEVRMSKLKSEEK